MVHDIYARYAWLMDLIYRQNRVTFCKIDMAWKKSYLNFSGEHLPKRTFHRWRDAIESNFGIIISCDKSDDYSYYIENPELLEKNSLMFSLFNSMMINNISAQIKNYHKRILLEEVPSQNLYLKDILEAMRDSFVVKITYEDPWRRHIKTQTFDFEPYAVKIFKRRWYIIGKFLGENEIKHYPLDRINNLFITDKNFEFDESFDGKEYFKDCHGIITDSAFPPERVVIKFDSLQRGYIRSLPLHWTQKEIESTDEYSVFEYYIKPTYDFLLEILAQGESFTILEPDWVRLKMVEYGKTIWKMNKG